MRKANLASAPLALLIALCFGGLAGAQNSYSGNGTLADGGFGMTAPAPGFSAPPGAQSGLSGEQFSNNNPNPSQGQSSVGDAGWANAFNTPNVSLPQGQKTTVHITAPQPHQLEGKSSEMQGGITQHDLAVLGLHDVSIIVDRSLSMTTMDCPGYIPGNDNWQRTLAGLLGPAYGMPNGMGQGSGGISRWQFVQQQAMALAKQTQDVFPQGITVELFSSARDLRIFHNVDLRQIPEIFAQNHPWGHTDTTGALEQQLNEYFARRNQTGGHCKPLAIAIITDGMPDNPGSLRHLIIEASHAMRNPHEITITFLQIGTEREGYELLHDLDQNLLREGAKYDIVDSKPFPEVVQAGLARCLVDAITSNGKN